MTMWTAATLNSVTDSRKGSLIITFAEKKLWLSGDELGIQPRGDAFVVLVRTSVGESLPVAVPDSEENESVSVVFWRDLRIIRAGRESGYILWSQHSILRADVAVVLIDTL